jgi:dTMP kinase
LSEGAAVSKRFDRGVLVALEGIDGAGKTTQAERLSTLLREEGLEVVRTKEPTEGPWGRKLRESAQSGRLSPEEELECFLRDRREHVETLLKPSLAAGKVVLVDRYYFSTVAYQGSRGLDPAELLRRNEAFAPPPDLLVLMEIPPELSLRRIRRRSGEENLFEKEDSLRAVDAIFRSMDFPYLLRLDGTASPEELTGRILDQLRRGPFSERRLRPEDG